MINENGNGNDNKESWGRIYIYRIILFHIFTDLLYPFQNPGFAYGLFFIKWFDIAEHAV